MTRACLGYGLRDALFNDKFGAYRGCAAAPKTTPPFVSIVKFQRHLKIARALMSRRSIWLDAGGTPIHRFYSDSNAAKVPHLLRLLNDSSLCGRSAVGIPEGHLVFGSQARGEYVETPSDIVGVRMKRRSSSGASLAPGDVRVTFTNQGKSPRKEMWAGGLV